MELRIACHQRIISGELIVYDLPLSHNHLDSYRSQQQQCDYIKKTTYLFTLSRLMHLTSRKSKQTQSMKNKKTYTNSTTWTGHFGNCQCAPTF